MRSLIIGMGIGQLYKGILDNMGHEVVTVDLDVTKGANYTHLSDCLGDYDHFDTVHICTPNFTHYDLAVQVSSKADIVFIEKPGCQNAAEWHSLVYSHPNTRFMMVKNNMWRDNIDELRKVAHESKHIELNWINKDRVPNPGTWFTTKELAYGGVSRDLMPHLLSFFEIFEKDYINHPPQMIEYRQDWELEDLTRSDYGTVNPDGTYDVDDFCRMEFEVDGREYTLTANWRSNDVDERLIRFHLDDDINVVAQLGLCPEDAYERMIKDAIANKDDMLFWEEQYGYDMWIHEVLA